MPYYMQLTPSILGNTKSSRGSSNYKEDIGSELQIRYRVNTFGT